MYICCWVHMRILGFLVKALNMNHEPDHSEDWTMKHHYYCIHFIRNSGNEQKLIKSNAAKHLSQMILFRYFSRHKQNPRKELISGSHFLTSQMQKRLRLLIFEAQHAIVTHFLFCLSKADTFLSKCKAAKKYNQLSAGNHSHTKFGKALLGNLVTASSTGAFHFCYQSYE